MKKLLYILFAVLFTFQTTDLFAWGTTGHRVVAEIAERNLSKKAKKELKKLIGNQKLAYWANYPDFLKSDPTWKFADSWHYINMPEGLDRDEFNQMMEASTDENAYKRALLLIDELKDPSISIEQKKIKLYFLIHIIGDVHQPLHIGRPDDLGGNRIKVEWFRKNTNIHSLWDSALVDFDKYSYTEYATVLDVHSKQFNNDIIKGDLNDWIYDSYQKAEEIYAATPAESSLSYRYSFDFQGTIENQLLKGGLRLADVLNDIFK